MGNFILMAVVTVVVIVVGIVIHHQYTVSQIEALRAHRAMILNKINTNNQRIVDEAIKPTKFHEREAIMERMMWVCFNEQYRNIKDIRERAMFLTNERDVKQVKLIDEHLEQLMRRVNVFSLNN